MNELTLVLPFALPPPELAADLLRALQAPALAALLSRTASQGYTDFDNGTRVLPHEAWLAHALGLGAAPQEAGAGAPFAASAMRGYGLAPSEGHWFLVHPVHVQISRNHLLMGDARLLGIDEADSRALFDAARPYFDDIGKPLLYGDARTWFVRADDWAGLRTASPDAAAGQNLTAWMPEGDGAPASRKLQNDIQMLWHAHPVNQAREARGQPVVNAFWLWGGAAAPTRPDQAAAPLFIADSPAWLAALAGPARRSSGADPATNAAAILGGPDAAALVLLGALVQDGLGGDWSSWLMRLQRLEQEWFAPLLAALKEGRLGRLTLVLNHRDAWAEFSSTKNAQRKFWRKPTLHGLIR
ncbi:MAG TPA: hypothetical protein VGP06_19750 [Janthinobacterium sp.]|nr:hypothetical protein [Janthinobacterium sp.]